MSERIELEYNGRTLTFREDDDDWHCHPLKLHAKSLTALKRKIDKLDGEARRVSFPAMRVDHYGKPEAAQIVMIAKQKDWERKGYNGADYSTRAPTVWILRSKGNQQDRTKVKLDECFEPTESNLATLAEAQKLSEQAKALEEQAKATIASIPRLTLDDITAKDIKEEALDE